MAKLLTAFLLTGTFLWLGADVGARESILATPAVQNRAGYNTLEKKIEALKVPANNCIVSGEESGQILEHHALQCNKRRNWLNINFDGTKEAL
tara:strand:+ start:1621 stop:1899 length:279 start_codon:yes stop_codon:yes gene_type:complete